MRTARQGDRDIRFERRLESLDATPRFQAVTREVDLGDRSNHVIAPPLDGCATSISQRRNDPVQHQRRSDQRQMRERLRKVANLPFRLVIVFLGQQSDIVA